MKLSLTLQQGIALVLKQLESRHEHFHALLNASHEIPLLKYLMVGMLAVLSTQLTHGQLALNTVHAPRLQVFQTHLHVVGGPVAGTSMGRERAVG